MSNFFKKIFDENNLIIVIPAIIVILIITAFMIYGFTDPRRTDVETVDTIIEEQIKLEAELIAEYEAGTYSENVPYIKVNPYKISPLSALMMFETEETKNYLLVVKGRTEEADWEFVTEETTSHKIPLLGLYNGITNIELYDVDPVTKIPGSLVYSTEISITLDIVANKLISPSKITTTHDYFGDNLMMLTPATSNLPIAYDYLGDIRWVINEPLAFAPNFLENGHLLIGSNRIISDPYYTTGLFEIDLLGKIYTNFYIPGGYHHDWVELENGNLLVLSDDFEGTVEDIVVEIDRTTGEVIKSWDIADYLNMFDGPAAMWSTSDWFHNNSIDYDKETDSIILSGRHQDAVISIGYTSRELNWVIGDPDNWDAQFVSDYFFHPIGENFEWQYAQHDAIVLPDGNIMLFDNGNNKAKNNENYVDPNDSYSRGVIYDINTDTMEISQLYQFGKELGSSFYSPYISNIAYYEDGHYMIHSGGISSVDGNALNIPAPLYQGEGVVVKNSITVEVKDDVIEYTMEVPDNYYRAAKIMAYNEKTTFSFGAPEILGRMAETKQYTDEVTRKLTIFHNVPPKHELTLVKEPDRLIVEGVFENTDLIYLVLENEDSTIYYHIPTSRTAYTAMCTAIFQDNSRFLTFYINEENVSGTYNVRININGHTYDTYKQVKFTE